MTRTTAAPLGAALLLALTACAAPAPGSEDADGPDGSGAVGPVEEAPAPDACALLARLTALEAWRLDGDAFDPGEALSLDGCNAVAPEEVGNIGVMLVLRDAAFTAQLRDPAGQAAAGVGTGGFELVEQPELGPDAVYLGHPSGLTPEREQTAESGSFVLAGGGVSAQLTWSAIVEVDVATPMREAAAELRGLLG